MIKILVTGGAGYIGSILVEKLLEQNYQVTILDNFHYGQNSLGHLIHNNNLNIHNADCRNESLIKDLIPKHDVIIPLAALVGAPICKFDPVGSRSINFDAVNSIFNKISKQQIIIMPTTNSAYGSGNKNNYCDEKSPLNPISKYAVDKVELEEILLQKNNFISLRLATVFGMSPRMRVDLLVNDFVLRALKDNFIVLFESEFKRNFIHIRDVSKAFLFCLENFSDMKDQIYNVGLSDANLSKKELCYEIKNQIPNFIFLEDKYSKDPDQRNYIVSNDKIEKLGFKPDFSIQSGISELIKGYQTLKIRNYSNI